MEPIDTWTTPRELWIYRVEIRCLEEYARALARLDEDRRKQTPMLTGREPFESLAWYRAVILVYGARRGFGECIRPKGWNDARATSQSIRFRVLWLRFGIDSWIY